MAMCEECGAPADGADDFCGACGAFTGWRRDAAPAVAAAAAAPAPQSAGPAEPAEAAGAGTAAEAPAAPVPAPAPVPKPEPEPAEAREPSVAVMPGKPSLERVERRSTRDEYVASPDDLECPDCHSPNPAARRFCRRCGHALAVPVVAARAPWWRRLAARLAARRRRRRLARSHNTWAKISRVLTPLLALAVVGGAVWLATPYVPRILGDVRNHVAKRAPVNPQTVTASSSAPGHPAAYAADGTWNKWWAPTDPAGGQWVQADFAAGFDLSDLVVLSGASELQDQYLQEARPHVFQLTAWVADGRTVTRTITLQDHSGVQDFPLAIPGVTQVRLTIVSSYGQGPGRLTAVGELEFYELS
jgi:hypothetical protein